MNVSLILMVFLGFAILRTLRDGGYRRARRWERSALLEEKIARLESVVTELQEQTDQDRSALRRLEEERDFLRQLYPAKEEARS